jgi:PAS domain-containing protein
MIPAESITDLKTRIDSLEHNQRKILNALDMALTLSDFQEEINQRFQPHELFSEIQARLDKVFPFDAYAFYFVDQASSDFGLSVCQPDDRHAYFENEFDFLIDNGFVAWAIREKKGITVAARDHKGYLFLHPIATQSRTRGLFIGRLPNRQKSIPEGSIYLISIILRNAANALESTEHYTCIAQGKELHESKNRIEAVLSSLPIGIFIVDAETGRIMDANPLALSTIGISQDNIARKKLSDLLVSETGNAPGNTSGFCEGVIKAHHQTPIPVYTTAIRSAIGDRNCMIVSFMDIREKRKLERERNLKEKFLGIIELSGAVCHEFNQPLQVIMGNAEYMMMHMTPDNEYYENIRDIKKYSEKMGAYTRKLMKLTRYETKDYLSGQILDIDLSSG